MPPTKSDIYAPLSIEHVVYASVIKQDGEWRVHARVVVPAVVAGVPSLTHEAVIAIKPEVVPQILGLLQAELLPALAIDAGLTVAP